MKNASVSSYNSGTFPSPGSPNCHESGDGLPKGWSSERVPLPVNNSRRRISSALMPFNSGRTLPSKWDDAERWIASPVSAYGISKTPLLHCQRRPKSKSGPLGPTGNAYYSNYSPSMQVFDGRRVRNVVGSPFSAGVMVADGLSITHNGGGDVIQSYPKQNADNVEHLDRIQGWSELLSEASLPSSQDEKPDVTKDGDSMVSRVVSRRDMATQMSPESSIQTSPKQSCISSTSNRPQLEMESRVKFEIKDVPVDKRATVIRRSKKHGGQTIRRPSLNVDENTSLWDTAKNTSKFDKEEAKISAWENLQKAKAEAAIRKLEMKLEKKRSSAMDKILNKLRLAQMKAQDMRNSMLGSQANPQVHKNSYKIVPFRESFQMVSLRNCFTCHEV